MLPIFLIIRFRRMQSPPHSPRAADDDVVFVDPPPLEPIDLTVESTPVKVSPPWPAWQEGPNGSPSNYKDKAPVVRTRTRAPPARTARARCGAAVVAHVGGGGLANSSTRDALRARAATQTLEIFLAPPSPPLTVPPAAPSVKEEPVPKKRKARARPRCTSTLSFRRSGRTSVSARAPTRSQYSAAEWDAAIANAMAPSDAQKAVLLKMKIPREMVEAIETTEEAGGYITAILAKKACARGRR